MSASRGARGERFCRLTGSRLPIVQTGMGWVAGARLVAASSRAGALGVLASATMSLSDLEKAISEVKDRTGEPFGVNLRPDAPDAAERVELVVREGVRVASFTHAPGAPLVGRLKDAGVVVMSTIGALRHAEKVAALGIDAVIAQGAEGGGHTGSVPTSLLVPGVVDAIGDGVVVLAAGGMHDGRSLAAAISWGADGVAMGTRFLLTKESTVPDEVKKAYLATSLGGTVVTARVDGAPQRVIRTDLIERLERAGPLGALWRSLSSALSFRRQIGASFPALVREGMAMHREGHLSWPQVLMAANAPMMTRAALVDGRLDAGVLPAGQVVGLINDLPSVEELVSRIVAEAGEALGVDAWTEPLSASPLPTTHARRGPGSQ